jgi:predicted dehydrogenase
MAELIRMGVIGCGAISGAYLNMAKSFPVVEVAACADLEVDRARAKAEEFGVPRACSVEELLADESIGLVLNLTVPKAHVPVGLAVLEAGKHLYLEKPLGISREEGRKLLEKAREKGLRVGCAPDTFMGAGVQTARKLIEEGAIGRPVAFTAFMMGRGHESWHPNPEFYYEPGGGPMFDMGPYYLTALLNLLGPVKRIMGMTSIAIPERTITHRNRQTGEPGPKFGKRIAVKTADHVCGMMEFDGGAGGGAVGTIIQSFATMHPQHDRRNPITIYGTEGTMKVPDPNGFDGPVFVQREGEAEMREVPHAFVKGYGRSVGAADMAYALRTGRAHRASGEQAMAVLDLMQEFLDSSESGRAYHPAVEYERPEPMPAELAFGVLD